MKTNTTALLDLWMAKKGLETDYQAFQALHLSGQSAVSNWRNGRSHAAPALVEKMAREAGEEPGVWLARIEADRAKRPEDAKAWSGLAARLAGVLSLPLMSTLRRLTGRPQRSADASPPH